MRLFKFPTIFKNGQFLRLWANQVFLQVGFNMCNYTSLLIIANITHSPFAQAQLYVALTIPAALFGLVAGGIVDMINRKRLILITDLLMAGLFFLYVFTSENVLSILIIAFLTSSVLRFFIPAEAASIPLVVSKDTLDHANALFLFTLLGATILGFALAGPVVELFGGLDTNGKIAPFAISSVMLLIGFFLVLNLKQIVTIKLKTPDSTLIGKIFLLFFEMLREVKTNKRASFPIALLVFIELILGILSITFLEYVRQYLHLPLTSVSYVLIVPVILGLLVGMAFLDKAEKQYGRRKSIMLSVMATGLLLFMFGLLPLLFSKENVEIQILRIFSAFAAFFMGILIVFISVQARTILQISTKVEMHGRIFSFLDIMIALVTPIPVLLIGFAADKVSLPGTFVFIGLTIIVAAIIGSKMFFGKEIR